MHHPAMVYVLDGDPTVRSRLNHLLRNAGHDVRAFASREDFPDEPETHPVCLILDTASPQGDWLHLETPSRDSGAALPILFAPGIAREPSAEGPLMNPTARDLLLGAIRAVIERDPNGSVSGTRNS